MNQIIDARVRPPYGDLLNLAIFPPADMSATDASYAAPAGQLLTRAFVKDDESIRDRKVETLLSEMNDSGVSLGIVHGRKASSRHGSVRNEHVYELLDMHPERFRGVIGADIASPESALAEIGVAAEHKRVHGVAFDSGWQDNPLPPDDESLFPLYDACQSADLTIVIVCSMLAGPDMSFSDPARIERLARQFRKARFGIVHGCFPHTAQAIGLLVRATNVWMIPDFYHFVPGMPGAEMWTSAINGLGRQRIVYASSYPVRPVSQSVELFRATGVSDASLPRVMHDNAVELFRLDG